MDRWTIARDGSTFTIEREVSLRGGTAEAVLLYEKKGFQPRVAAVRPPAPAPAAAIAAPQTLQSPAPAPKPAPKQAGYTIDAESRIRSYCSTA